MPIHDFRPKKIKVYTDATYKYVCMAAPTAALASSVWAIQRIALDGTTVDWPGSGDESFSYAATDLTTVQGHFA